jgi:hypothetical protein
MGCLHKTIIQIVLEALDVHELAWMCAWCFLLFYAISLAQGDIWSVHLFVACFCKATCLEHFSEEREGNTRYD